MEDRFDGPAVEANGVEGPIAWERTDARFPGDLFDSWLECMTRPFEFFGRLDPRASVARPLSFFLVFWVLGGGLGTLSTRATVGGWYADQLAVAGEAAPGPTWYAFMFFVSPFIGSAALALYIGLTHLGVRLFVREARPIGITGRGLCYVSAPQVVAIVPIVGWFAASLWSLFLAVVSVQRLHHTTTGRAVGAVLVPQVAFWLGLSMLFVIFMVLLALAAGGV